MQTETCLTYDPFALHFLKRAFFFSFLVTERYRQTKEAECLHASCHERYCPGTVCYCANVCFYDRCTWHLSRLKTQQRPTWLSLWTNWVMLWRAVRVVGTQTPWEKIGYKWGAPEDLDSQGQPHAFFTCDRMRMWVQSPNVVASL